VQFDMVQPIGKQSAMEFKRGLSLHEAYEFLSQNGLTQECEDIKNSSDKFKSYTSTLRRAKLIVLVKDKKLLDKFATLFGNPA